MIPTFKLNGVVSAAIVLVAAVAIPLWMAHLLGVVEFQLTVWPVVVGALFRLDRRGFHTLCFGQARTSDNLPGDGCDDALVSRNADLDQNNDPACGAARQDS